MDFFFIFNKKKWEKRCICAFKRDKGPKRKKIKIKDQRVTNK